MTTNENVRIGLFGRGRLGTAVVERIGLTPGVELAWVAGRGEPPCAGADVVLDASSGSAVAEHLRWALETGTSLAIGATGWDTSVVDALAGRPLDIGVMVAPNFSLAVALMRRSALALGRLAARESDADLSVMERHHSGKVDSPSGTAKLLASALADGSGRHRGWISGAAETGAISIASLRSGQTVGYHEIRYEAPFETIVLSHEALSRGLYARGALEALVWLRNRRGVYSFDDFAAEVVDPLFYPRNEDQYRDNPFLTGEREGGSVWTRRAV
ncbi:MAG: hypothetical protein CVV47_13105 [Spirochaetae bacterium HGW-Spirochaetae-3]|jgi:4-hydroxy-tetrahydrodipicolinate reductase|nr:MAG: hypothetical protein CVV47_13105 [Spirochaetae bacterium HGW-Spirochaetae-3]